MMALQKKIRLFWAINLPGELRSRIARLQNRLKNSGVRAKWVECHNLHITVKFLGDTDVGLVARIVDSAASSLKSARPFRLEAGGLGFFPGPANPRVLWAGLKVEVCPEQETGGRGVPSSFGVAAPGGVGACPLENLVLTVGDAMAGLGFPPEGRRFFPHLTLARIKSNAPGLIGIVEAEAAGAEMLGSFNVSSVDLMHSDLTPGGPVYTLLASCRF